MLPPGAFDREGFLRRLEDWTPGVARQIAASEQIVLTDAHWEVLKLLRQYYREFDSSPAMRPLVKYCALKLGADKGCPARGACYGPTVNRIGLFDAK